MRLAHTMMALGAVALLGACASAHRPPELEEATSIYNRVAAASPNEDRVSGELLRAQEAINTADNALASHSNQDYINGLSHIALRNAQIAEAAQERTMALAAADSLQKARLARLVALSQSQRDSLARANALSQAEVNALQQQNLLIAQEAVQQRARADSLDQALSGALGQLRTLVVEITNLQETARGLVISLSDVLFDVDKATLREGSQRQIDKIAAVLKQFPDHQISVEGHTDATGSDAYNQKLSEDRAASVKAALITGGVDPSRITSQGFGESKPVATNATAAGRQQNRRVEVVVLGAGSLAEAAGEIVRPDSAARDTSRVNPPMFDSTRTVPPDTTRRPPR